ncbi:MAG: glycosyltransferase family 2 protein [candidate division KSB1 bacterium]|nr:glycosyltransferase family 2 protein [candidate division KSB1 bacterium]
MMSNQIQIDDNLMVSFVIPMLNERDAIERCLDSILSQNYPGDKIEILVIDGMSEDGSRDIVKSLAERFEQIKLFDNPRKRTPASLNIGARNAQGDIVVILGAHTKIHPDFVKTNVRYMNELGVKCVGGTQINVGETPMQKAIGIAMGSIFGIPSAPYRFYKKKKYVDTVVYAAYKKELFEKIGYFDEELHISEDAEFNWRIRQAGYKIFYTPEIISYYYPRKNLKTLFRQFYNYGILRVNVIKKHFDAFKFIHILPPLFVSLLIITAISGILIPKTSIFFLVLTVIYLVYLIIGALITAQNTQKPGYTFKLVVIFMTMHTSWGLGFLRGLFKTYN